MGRLKSERNLSFKPLYKHFVPKGIDKKGSITLLAEEIEALYLMDILGLYQEESAKKMEVSRPTFARILKNARKKITLALVSGHEIVLEDLFKDMRVAICVNKEDNLQNAQPTDRYIQIFKINKDEIVCIKTLQNPLFQTKQKPAIVLPEILLKEEVNIFLSSHVGVGLKNSLMLKGIDTIVQKNFNLTKLQKEFYFV